MIWCFFFLQEEDGIRELGRSRGLGDVYKRQGLSWANGGTAVQVNGDYRNFGDLVGGKGIGKQSPSGYDQWAYQAKFKTALHPKWSLTGLWQDSVSYTHLTLPTSDLV